jgi:hypothetical protein
VPNRKTAKKAEEKRISQTRDFKTRMGGIQELPSGLVVKLRNPGGLMAFMDSKNIPNALLAIIQRSLGEGKAPSPEELMSKNGELDPEMLDSMKQMMDVVALRCIVKPPIAPELTDEDVVKWNAEHPDDLVDDVEDLRDDETLYIDEIPYDDKMFIFQWVSGGTRDLETFRQRHDEGMAAVAKSSSAVRDAQLAAGLDPR